MVHLSPSLLSDQLLAHPVTSISHRLIEGGEVESDDSSLKLDDAWTGNVDSDAESVDSDLDDPLK